MKHNLFKTLLAVVALTCFGGGKMWADEITATLVHTASTSGDGNNAAITVTVDAVKEAHNQENKRSWDGYAFAEFSFVIPEGQKITSATLSWKGYGDSNRNRTSDIYGLNAGKSIDYDAIQAAPVLLGFMGEKKSIITGCLLPSKKEASFDTDVTSFVQEIAESQNYVIFQWTNNAQGGQLYGKESDKAPVLVITTADVSTTTNYTIKYLLGEYIVKTTEGEGLVDDVIASEPSIDGEGEYAGTHYIVSDVTLPSKTLVADASANVLNVAVRLPYTATLQVNKVYGNNDPVTETINLVEADDKSMNYTFVYSKYVLHKGKYYMKTEAPYGESGTFAPGETITKTVNYVLDETVVYFAEGSLDAGTNPAYSNGGTAVVAAQNARDRGFRVSLTAGQYAFQAVITNNAFRNLVIRNANNIDEPVAELTTSGVATGNFNVQVAADFWINGKNSGEVKTNQSADFDYFLIRKLSESVTIGAHGWSSYSSPYALDFGAKDEVLAYVATKAENDVVTLTEVEGVIPANTGVMLYGTANAQYDIPVSSEEPAVIETNLLRAVSAGSSLPASDSEATRYVYGSINGKVGFFKLATTMVTVPNTMGGASYLEIPGASAVRMFSIAFADEDVTAIETVKTAENSNDEIFTLQGVRVAKANKGIYIVNGKKVVVK